MNCWTFLFLKFTSIFLLQKFKIEQLDKRECKEAGGDTLKFLGVEEVKKLLQIKDSKAYEVIRQLNTELAQKGYLTVRGKVPEKYLLEQFYS